MPTKANPPNVTTAASSRARRRPTVTADVGQRVTYTEAIQDEHERRIGQVETRVDIQGDITQAAMASATNVANRLTEFGAKMVVIEGRATEWHTWIEENRSRQPERDRKDRDDSALLEKLAAAEEGRSDREALAATERAATAKVLADKLAASEAERVRHEKRNTTLLKAAAAGLLILLAALSPSVVSQFPVSLHPAGYAVYAAGIAIAVIIVVVSTIREGMA